MNTPHLIVLNIWFQVMKYLHGYFSDFLHIKHTYKQLFQEGYFESFPC